MRSRRPTYVDPMLISSVSSTLSATPPPPPPPPPFDPSPDRYELIQPAWIDQRHAPPVPTATQTTFRHSHWAKARERVRRAMVDAELPLARRYQFQCCGSGAQVQVDALSGQVRVTAHCCHDRWCRACGRIRRQRLARALSGCLGNRRAMHVVLTLKSSDAGLSGCLDHLLASFSKLRRAKVWTDSVKGGAWTFECTWNAETRQWHPHLHTIVHGSWMALADLSAAWHQATGDSWRVHISLVNNSRTAIAELTKYVGKITHRTWSHDHDLLVHAIRALNGRRLCSTFGTWRGIDLQPHGADATVRQWITWGSVDAMFRLSARGDPDACALLAALASGEPVRVPTQNFPATNRQRAYSQAHEPAPPSTELLPALA